MWCEPAENVSGVDINGDGVFYDRNDSGQSSGVESTDNGGKENE